MLKHLSRSLKSLPKNPEFLKPNSHFHTRNKTLISNPAIDFILEEVEDLQPSGSVKVPTPHAPETAEPVDPASLGFRVPHQWPEWVVLMEKLTENGYFDGVGNPYRRGGLIDGKSCNQIRTACLNFARDQPDLMRYFTHREIRAVAGSGCPSIGRKVVNSGKRLRAYVGIDEGDVCSSCALRGNCERAYVKAHEVKGGHGVDMMRLVLAYSLDHAAENKPCLNERLEEAIRSLIKEMVKFDFVSSKTNPSKEFPSIHGNQTVPTTEGDWNCSKCKFLNFARNIKCVRCNGLFQERLGKSGNNEDHLQLKKGDWVCLRCNFLNFAKNTRCLQCQMNPPKRKLDPGEWECDSCNYINFKRNVGCLKCDHKRPKSLNNSLDYDNGTHH